jgi:hypothetical protein
MTYTMKPLPFDPASIDGSFGTTHPEPLRRQLRGAVHMDYGANAADYVDAFMQNIHWDNVAKRFASIRHPS